MRDALRPINRDAGPDRSSAADGHLGRRSGTARFETPLALECGRELPSFEVAYETYGTLNAQRSNAILLCHGLTANQHAAGTVAGKKGWWDVAVGPGKMIDTDRYFVVSPNVLGGGNGSTGPRSTDPHTGRPYGMRLPMVTIGDMVESQAHLADVLSIDAFHAVVGGCMGGFQALEWMARYPERTRRTIIISATPRVSTHTIALWSVMRRAIRSDPNWNGGDYYAGAAPDAGMGLLATFGALYWMSRDVLAEKYGLRTVADRDLGFSLESEFAVEAFLDQVACNAQGKFDANTLIYLTRAMDYFDLDRSYGSLTQAFAAVTSPTLLVSYETDWRYPPAEMNEIADALRTVGACVRHEVLNSRYGHGAFLCDVSGLTPVITEFLARNEPAPTQTFQST